MTNKKEETFESYFDYWIEHNFGRGELMQLKQLHDDSIQKKNKIIQDKNKSIKINHQLMDNYKFKIKELQAEVEKLKEELLLRRDEGLSFED